MSRRKSAQQKIAAGDPRRQGVHTLDRMLEAEPKCQTGLPPCPARLKGDARALYQFFSEQLALSDLDKRPDGPALELACVAWARVWACDRKLQRGGLIVKVPILAGKGEDRKVVGFREARSKLWLVRVDSVREFARLAGAFGLVGPSSRAGLEVNPVTPAARDELSRLLNSEPVRKHRDAVTGEMIIDDDPPAN